MVYTGFDKQFVFSYYTFHSECERHTPGLWLGGGPTHPQVSKVTSSVLTSQQSVEGMGMQIQKNLNFSIVTRHIQPQQPPIYTIQCVSCKCNLGHLPPNQSSTLLYIPIHSSAVRCVLWNVARTIIPRLNGSVPATYVHCR